VQCLVDEQTEIERDALRNTQPMQVVANQWRQLVSLISVMICGSVLIDLFYQCNSTLHKKSFVNYCLFKES